MIISNPEIFKIYQKLVWQAMELVWQKPKLVGQLPHQLNRKLHPCFRNATKKSYEMIWEGSNGALLASTSKMKMQE